jgi:hypothetical protein
MKTEQFNEIVSNRIESIQDVLMAKAKEYSSDTDRLHNFKVAAALASRPETPEQALWGMMRKHLVSVIDIIDQTAIGNAPSDHMRNEKIGDSINYLILLEALLIERQSTATGHGIEQNMLVYPAFKSGGHVHPK